VKNVLLYWRRKKGEVFSYFRVSIKSGIVSGQKELFRGPGGKESSSFVPFWALHYVSIALSREKAQRAAHGRRESLHRCREGDPVIKFANAEDGGMRRGQPVNI